MRLRTEPQLTQIRLRTPRVPSVPFTNNSFSKALTKEIFLFDQGFFFAQVSRRRASFIDQGFFIVPAFKRNVFRFHQGLFIPYLILRFQTKLISLWKLIFQPKFIFQFYISYLTPAS